MLKRDARDFAARVRMSQIRVFLIVEGRKTDRPFYERVLRELGGLEETEFALYLSEEISLETSSGQGKRHLLALLDFWEDMDVLTQENSGGPRVIAIAVDRDRDRPADGSVRSKHIFYSLGADVEADILRHGDIIQSVADAFSITRSEAERILPSGGVFECLAFLWSEWIILGARGAACGSELSYGRQSLINGKSSFEVIDGVQLKQLSAKVDQEAEAKGLQAEVEVAGCLAKDQLGGHHCWRLVKGKWVASYIHYLVDSHRINGSLIEAGVNKETVTKTCLAGMSWTGEMESHHRAQVRTLLGQAGNWRGDEVPDGQVL